MQSIMRLVINIGDAQRRGDRLEHAVHPNSARLVVCGDDNVVFHRFLVFPEGRFEPEGRAIRTDTKGTYTSSPMMIGSFPFGSSCWWRLMSKKHAICHH